MTSIVEEFNAIFRGGIGTNGYIKHSLVIVQVMSDGTSKFRFWGRKTWKMLFNQGWNNGIVDLTGKDEHNNLKYPFTMIELYQGGESVPVRMYDVSLKLEPYRSDLSHSALYIQNQQKGIEVMELRQKLATALSKANILSSGDRLKKEEFETAKHHKKVRSQYTFNDFPRGEI